MAVEVSEANFKNEVLEASQKTPVLVDFWAEWCGPCRMLGPVLEKLEKDYKGRFKLVKINTDLNPNLAMAFQISGIPAVKLVIGGRLASEFTGALPEPAVRKFLDQHLPAAGLEGQEEIGEEDPLGAAERVLTEKTEGPEASRALWNAALLCFASGEAPATALRFLEGIPESGASESEGRNGLRRLLAEGSEADREKLRTLFQPGREEEALQFFLQRVEDATVEQRADAKAGLLLCFHILGSASNLANQYRRKLAALLF
ncbi:MAG: tetratricopeptide repeat protein [Leptospirales bacterium]|nr:tetratricopeptide repeat protein [Leptospirales bacterium]